MDEWLQFGIVGAVLVLIVLAVFGLRAIRNQFRELVRTHSLAQAANQRFQLLVQGVTDYAIFLARPAGQHHQLEFRRGADQGLYRRRSHRPAYFAILHAGRSRQGGADPGAGDRGERRQIRGRGLARAQGRHPVLGQRRHRPYQRPEGRGRRFCQDHARHHGSARRRSSAWKRRASSSINHKKWTPSASSPAAWRTISTIS